MIAPQTVDGREIYWRYWNSTLDTDSHLDGIAIYIISVVNPGVDWAAYIGASQDGSRCEPDGLRHVIRYGEKLPEEEAHFMLRHFEYALKDLEYRR